MSIEIEFEDSGRRSLNGQIFDVIDYRFLLSNGRSARTIAVGITGQFHDPAEALGSKGLPKKELSEAARAWLQSRVNKGYDPITFPETATMLDLPAAVMDYWIQNRSIPSWL
jgi:hypothetical protein